MGLFTMPTLGADMERGTLLEWRVAPGDHVEKGDIVALIDTAKSTVEIEVFEAGTVAELLVEPGTEVDVGTPLARIDAGAELLVAAPPVAAPVDSGEPPPVAAPPVAAPPVEEPTSRVTSPLVRHLAEELGVDTAHVTGSGVGHRLTRADVERAAASPLARRRAAEMGLDLGALHGTGPGGAVRERDLPTAPEPATPSTSATPDSHAASMRGAIARLMSASNRDIPHYHLEMTIDLHESMQWLARHNEGRSAAQRVLPAALLLAASARAMTIEPRLNGTWEDDRFVAGTGVHVAVAVSLRSGGLVAPVIRDADRRSIDDIMAALLDLVTRSRRGSLRGSDLGSASFTVTDLGEHGADAVFGVIHPPQVALVGFGGIVDRPWAVDGMLAVRPTVTATLAADHRATDGHVGSRFLTALRDQLEHPSALEAGT